MIVIKTDRLYLRCYKEKDFEGLHAIFSDPETMANYPAPFTVQETQNWIKEMKHATKTMDLVYGESA